MVLAFVGDSTMTRSYDPLDDLPEDRPVVFFDAVERLLANRSPFLDSLPPSSRNPLLANLTPSGISAYGSLRSTVTGFDRRCRAPVRQPGSRSRCQLNETVPWTARKRDSPLARLTPSGSGYTGLVLVRIGQTG